MQMYTAMTVMETSQREPAGDVGEPVVVCDVSIMNNSAQESSATVEHVSLGNTPFLPEPFGVVSSVVRSTLRGYWARRNISAQQQKKAPEGALSL
jgi:hypothetical protein